MWHLLSNFRKCCTHNWLLTNTLQDRLIMLRRVKWSSSSTSSGNKDWSKWKVQHRRPMIINANYNHMVNNSGTWIEINQAPVIQATVYYDSVTSFNYVLLIWNQNIACHILSLSHVKNSTAYQAHTIWYENLPKVITQLSWAEFGSKALVTPQQHMLGTRLVANETNPTARRSKVLL